MAPAIDAAVLLVADTLLDSGGLALALLLLRSHGLFFPLLLELGPLLRLGPRLLPCRRFSVLLLRLGLQLPGVGGLELVLLGYLVEQGEPVVVGALNHRSRDGGRMRRPGRGSSEPLHDRRPRHGRRVRRSGACALRDGRGVRRTRARFLSRISHLFPSTPAASSSRGAPSSTVQQRPAKKARWISTRTKRIKAKSAGKSDGSSEETAGFRNRRERESTHPARVIGDLIRPRCVRPPSSTVCT